MLDEKTNPKLRQTQTESADEWRERMDKEQIRMYAITFILGVTGFVAALTYLAIVLIQKY